MELEMKFTERDKKLIIFLSLFLLIVGIGYFVVRPLYARVTELKTQAQDLQTEVEQTRRHLSQLPKLRKMNEENLAEKQSELEPFYPYMESQELDKMITELTLQQSLGAKNLTITIPDTPYVITPYFLSAPDTDADGEQLTESEAAYEAEKSDGSETGDETADQTDPEAMLLYAAKLSIDVTGPHDRLQAYIDLLSDDAKYPAIQIDSYSWTTDEQVGVDELGQFAVQSEDMLHMELSVYMQGKDEE